MTPMVLVSDRNDQELKLDLLNHHQTIVVFDGSCGLCCGTVKFLRSVDAQQRFYFVDSFSTEGAMLNSETRDLSVETVVVLTNGRRLIKSDAVIELLRQTGGIWKLFSLFRMVPRPIRDKMYEFISQRRYLIAGKKNVCHRRL